MSQLISNGLAGSQLFINSEPADAGRHGTTGAHAVEVELANEDRLRRRKRRGDALGEIRPAAVAAPWPPQASS